MLAGVLSNDSACNQRQRWLWESGRINDYLVRPFLVGDTFIECILPSGARIDHLSSRISDIKVDVQIAAGDNLR